MWGTIKWRLSEAIKILLGNDRNKISPHHSSPVSMNSLCDFEIEDHELKNLISSTKIEFLFSEFGEERVNAGGSILCSAERLNPSLATIRHYFPEAKFTVYSDFDLKIPDVNLIKVDTNPIHNPEHPRYLYRTADYYKFKALLSSDADFKCVVDSDMFACSPNIFSLVYLTKIFGFCAPYNPRNLLKRDMEISLDTREIKDLSMGFGHSYNQSPMTLWKGNENGHLFFEKCCELMISEPSRASLVMWKAARETGLTPYLLPQQWCVSAENVAIGNEVLLHAGHKEVVDYYNIKLL